MTKRAAKKLVQDFKESVLNARDLSQLEAFLAPDYVDHSAGLAGRAALTALRDGFRSWWTSFPDYRIEIKELVAERDLVAYRCVGRGTHSGEYMGVPATGKEISFEAHELYRLRDGKLAEHWEVWDEASVLRQLGLL